MEGLLSTGPTPSSFSNGEIQVTKNLQYSTRIEALLHLEQYIKYHLRKLTDLLIVMLGWGGVGREGEEIFKWEEERFGVLMKSQPLTAPTQQ